MVYWISLRPYQHKWCWASWPSKRGDFSRNGRQNLNILLNDRRMNVREISETVNISVGRVWHISHECLGMRELSAKWVPRLFSADHKRACVIIRSIWCHTDLASCDYFLFSNMKTWLGGKIFLSNEEIITAINEYSEGSNKNYFLEGIKKLEYHYNKWIQLKGDYVGK